MEGRRIEREGGEPFPLINTRDLGLRRINGKRLRVSSCLFVTTEGNMALGIMRGDELCVSTAGKEVALAQGWRALELTTLLPEFSFNILSSAWDMASRHPNFLDSSVSELSEFYTTDKLVEIREKLLALSPSAEELDVMIRLAQNAGVHIDEFDLKTELREGIITMTPLLQYFFDERKRKREQSKREEEAREERIKSEIENVQPENSFGIFLGQLEVGNIILEIPFGAYNFDWGHTHLSDVDARIITDTLRYDSSGRPLFCTTGQPRVEVTHKGEGTTQGEFSMSKIVHPWYQVDDIRYTFVHAQYQDGQFIIETWIDRPQEEVETEETYYTISQLRELLQVPFESRDFLA